MRKVLLLVILFFVLTNCGSHEIDYHSQLLLPTISASAAPNSIKEGESSTITWTTTNASRVVISGLPDVTSPFGVVVVYPIKTTQYAITAYGSSGQSAAPIVLTITVIPVIVPPPPPPPPTIGVVTIYVNLILPTTYTDNTLIDQLSYDNLVTHVFMKTTSDLFFDTDIPIGISAPGASTLTLDNVTVTLGIKYYFSARTHVSPDGLWSAFALPAEYTWIM